METIELNSCADPEQKNVILMPCTHTHCVCISTCEWKRFSSPQKCCILHGWLATSDAFNSDITQRQMFLIEKQKSIQNLLDTISLRLITIAMTLRSAGSFLGLGLNAGLCQLGFPEDRVSGLGVERERERKRKVREVLRFHSCRPSSTLK